MEVIVKANIVTSNTSSKQKDTIKVKSSNPDAEDKMSVPISQKKRTPKRLYVISDSAESEEEEKSDSTDQYEPTEAQKTGKIRVKKKKKVEPAVKRRQFDSELFNRFLVKCYTCL